MIYSAETRKLSSVCDIQIGYTVKSRLEPIAEGGVPAIQLRDLEGEADFDPAGLPAYPLAMSFERYWARPGDVLFRSRGDRNTAVVVAPDAKTAAIAILPLMVLRPNRDLVEPRYLAWFINQPASQNYFARCAHGTRMRMIPKGCLDDLEVALPDIATQRLVVEIDMLARRERALMQQLADKRFEIANLALLRQVRSAGTIRPVDRSDENIWGGLTARSNIDRERKI